MNSIQDDLYKRFNGLLPIKRENPRKGQSLWYYMMPIKGSDEDNPEYEYIDVPSQDTPNPRLQQTLVASQSNQTPLPTIDYTKPSSLLFDGKSLNWIQNNQTIKYWPAMSGNENYQSAKYTRMPDNGPIPEGNWILKQGSGQSYNPYSKSEKGLFDVKNWTDKPNSWGISRIPIQPLAGTNTFGRHSMYVHGGDELGSAGCIDLAGGNDDFYKNFINYNGDMNLTVKYPIGW